MKKDARILIGCEESQIVTTAFRNLGFYNTFSCDLQPTSGSHPEWHFQDDIFNVIMGGQWDLMIGHPPCQFITNAGIRWFNEERYGEKAKVRKANRTEAVEFFYKLWNCGINRICLENPVGYINGIMQPTQTIHPYYFGDNHKKRTCLWLKNLPSLYHSKEDNLFTLKSHLSEPQPCVIQYRKPSKYYKGGEEKKRYFTDFYSRDAKERSKTFQGIANAMAQQWGALL